jgi:hypothetical protein
MYLNTEFPSSRAKPWAATQASYRGEGSERSGINGGADSYASYPPAVPAQRQTCHRLWEFLGIEFKVIGVEVIDLADSSETHPRMYPNQDCGLCSQRCPRNEVS